MSEALVTHPPLSPATAETLDELFTYHPPTPDQIPLYGMLREKGRELAAAIVACCPASADRTAAVRKVREAVMTANASIALNGKGL